MEEHGGGSAGRHRHQRNLPPSDRFLGVSRLQFSSPTPPLELSEHDIFNTPSGSSSPSSTHSGSSPGRNPARVLPSHTRGHHGILAALNDQSPRSRSGSGSDSRPVFNHRASTSASLSSSSSTSPARSPAMIMIPKRPPPPPLPSERTRFQPQSAPVNVPVMPAALARRARELEEVVSEGEEEEDNGGVMLLPPHEVVAARNTPMLSCSVLEGAGRTLKGRDLRQVRNAIWRRTGFID
ncbi:Protein of unknown function- DUF584 [Striga hermonthica]|uniref:Senescence regulator n=1 Tax=Striga hermonthica TaxID=68872 RepID=A0A9N7P163_STRHE|nr:Protein of unknown function- DUF584 [Striga hermonthica]